MENILEKIQKELVENINNFKKMILSDTSSDIKKIVVRPILIKNKIMLQIERYRGSKVFHENIELNAIFDLPFSEYNQILIETIGKDIIFSKQKAGYKEKVRENAISQSDINLSHNKQKSYLINEGDNVPAMVDLGIFTKDGKIVKSKYDKFKQINRFIEIIDDVFKSINKDEITILDFGCGKSYLTFLVYYYFVEIKKMKAKIIGYDLKSDVVDRCNEIAKNYGYSGLHFQVNDVKKDKLYNGAIDVIISLHACDTATDFALDYAIKHKIPYIFSVPCCQHEINQTIKKGGDFDLLLNDGLIKERFSALLTDAIRVEILRAKGYDVDVIEFVDFAHSPKNIMLRANLTHKTGSLENIDTLMKKYNFSQKLYELNKK